MRKRLGWIVVGLPVLAILLVAGWEWYSDLLQARTTRPLTEKEVAASYRKFFKPPKPASDPKLSVVDMGRPVRLAIANLGLPDEKQNELVGDLTLVQLNGKPGLELIERQALGKVLRELGLTMEGFASAKDAVRVGKLLAADWFLLGTVAQVRGANTIVARVVDARTGLLRDVCALKAGGGDARLASELADFVRRCRNNTAKSRPPVLVALGTFQDLSPNNRLAGFAGETRAYLMEAYQDAEFSLLEREQVDALFQEMRLDFAGLAESNSDAPTPVLSAFWLLGGRFQSYNDTGVEMIFEIRRMFGRSRQFVIRERTKEDLFRKLKEVFDTTLSADGGYVLSRANEVKAQLQTGKELLVSIAPGWAESPDRVHFFRYHNMDEQEFARQRRTMEDAIRCYTTVLLLDPHNFDARMYLGACMQSSVIGRIEEARECYREILEVEANEQRRKTAQEALVRTLVADWPADSSQERFLWFDRAEKQAKNPAAVQFFRQQAEAAKADSLSLRQGSTPSETEVFKQQESLLIQSARAADDYCTRKANMYAGVGMESFVKNLGTNRALAVARLNTLLPGLRRDFTNIAHVLNAAALALQVDTNTPLLAEFERDLDWQQEHFHPAYRNAAFWLEAGRSVSFWCDRMKLHSLDAKILEAVQREAGRKGSGVLFYDRDLMRLAYAYFGAGRWQEASDVFDSFTNQPLVMEASGSWGPVSRIVYPGKMASVCRTKLGFSPVSDPREFQMGSNRLCLHGLSVFGVETNGLWVGIEGQLIHLGFNLKTNSVTRLPMDSFTPIYALCMNDSTIWIGTGGEGLIEVDKDTRQCRHLLEKDGLMRDAVASLYLADDTLWVGYGHQMERNSRYPQRPTGGGVGRMDLATHRFASFTPSLEGTRPSTGWESQFTVEPMNVAPRSAVVAMAVGTSKDVWFVGDRNILRRYRFMDSAWEGFLAIAPCSCLVADGGGRIFVGQQVVGQNRDYLKKINPRPRLHVFKPVGNEWGTISLGGMPLASVDALALDKRYIWVGGMGCVVQIDPDVDRVIKWAYVNSQRVDQIQVGGGYLWAKYDDHLYRVPLPETP